MAEDVIAFFTHPDGRWIDWRWVARRTDRIEGRRGDKTSVQLYRVHPTEAVAKDAYRRAVASFVEEGFREVKKIAGFVPPTEIRQDKMPAKGKPAAEDRALAARGKKEKKAAAQVARKRKLRPERYAGGSVAALVRAVKKRIDAIGRVSGVKMRAKWGKPVTAKVLTKAEEELGRPLPPSLRALLAIHDGVSIAWTHQERPWEVSFEVQPLRAMLRTLAEDREGLVSVDGTVLLPICERIDRWVIGVAIAPDGDEACVVEALDPPGGKRLVLASSFAAFLEAAAESFFVVRGRSDASEEALPAMRLAFSR